MSEQTPQTPRRQESSPNPGSSESKGGKRRKGPDLAPTQGTQDTSLDPADTPGTPEHLGSDRPYEGGSPDEVEGR